MNTTDLFLSLLASRKKWLAAGLKEFDRKYYLRLQKLGTLPHYTVMERRLIEAGYVKIHEVIEAEWRQV